MTADNDIVERLRALSRCEHSDLSVGDEAAAEIVRLRGEVKKWRIRFFDFAAAREEELASIAPAEAKGPAPAMPNGVEGLMQLARNWCLAWGEWAHDADPGGAKENAAEAALRAALTTALAQQPAAVDGACAAAAIQFALTDPEGMTFLRLGNEGDFDTLRREWPDAPIEVYVGADPLATQPGGSDNDQ